MTEDSPLSGIQLFNQTAEDLPLSPEDVRNISSLVASGENVEFSLLEVVYVDDKEIVRINKEYLERDYVTDIITFRYDEDPSNQSLEGTLYCCAPRIYEQALELDQDPGEEFKRILIHGILHLCGYEDENAQAKQQMSDRENYYLDQFA